MNIEDPFLVGIGIGLVVWLGQELIKYIVYRYNKYIQTRKIRMTFNDLYICLETRKSGDDDQYNNLFEFESKLEGIVRYANAIDYDKKVDIHGVIKQIASILNFVWRNRIPKWGTEHDRSYLNIGSNELELIKREIESISWLDMKINK